MPDFPSPYQMRNWKAVALGYDSLVFDLNKSGNYLPLSWLISNTVNYTNHGTFGMHSYVGDSRSGFGEGINCLPAVVGATLSGVDKSNQNGNNWALMCEEWFNRQNGENVYLNDPSASTGDDWWYETMPNVFFYQLYSLYPNAGNFGSQFTTVADRWLGAVYAMGGATTPWSLPNMDHRAWDLMKNIPNNTSVHEPESAGAIAWLLYNASVKTGNTKYRTGAELAMEFLNSYPSNPSYELQLSYGTYMAARMNAEIGTTYDVAKMVNWCFNVGSLRSWGAITGTWGGYDCSGLIGEVNGSNDYAFCMNTFEQIGALVPMVRYDPRFARAIGKWVLNAANAARLFYTNYLPDSHQDSYQWAHQYDSSSYIAHEAMREYGPGSVSPYATGDAISGGWAATNLGLYGSSHVGILGGIIDTTNVKGILKLDVLKTDYFHANAYPTFLFYNPDSVQQIVLFDVGSGQHDVYDAVSKSFLLQNVSGEASFPIPANGAVLAVVTPSGGTQTYDLEKFLVDGIVVDYHSGNAVANYPPRIKSLAASSSLLAINDSTNIYCTAEDRDNDSLTYQWNASGGTIAGSDSVVKWYVPSVVGTYTISCRVSDGHGGEDSTSDTIQVVEAIYQPPTIIGVYAHPGKIDLGATSTLTCVANEPNDFPLHYTWFASSGTINGTDSSVTWTAPDSVGNYFLHCTIDNSHGSTAADSVGIEVRDFTKNQTGNLIAYYPFNGNANDESGNGNNGTVSGAFLSADRFGNPQSAFQFNGTTSSIQVPNVPALNFQNSISVAFWMKVSAFYDTREEYPISHGNWQNRWKVSITNKHLRWTVRTDSGTKDLDSKTQLVTNTYYDVVVAYNGSDYEIYLNGDLDAFSSWSGLIQPSPVALTFGQDLPGDNNYNFNGWLDDIRIYNYALSMTEIQNLYSLYTSVHDQNNAPLPKEYSLLQNYPNPFNPATIISFQLPMTNDVTLKVYDVLGREVATLVNERKPPGTYEVHFDANRLSSGVYYYRLQTGKFTAVKKMVVEK